jgi:hypothetical protein
VTTSPLADGMRQITAIAIAPGGSASSASNPLPVTIDTVAPATLAAPDLDSVSDTGISATDNITRDNTPTFDGNTEPSALVRIFSDGTEVGSVTASTSSYAITTSLLPDAAHAITATATDLAGNASAVSASLGVTIDTIAPHIANGAYTFRTLPHRVVLVPDEDLSATLDVTDIATVNQTVGLAVPESSTQIDFVPNTNVAIVTFPGFTGGRLPDGRYHQTVSAAGVTDAAGNPLAADFTFDFFFLTGDANHDAHVDLLDFNILSSHFGQTDRDFSQGNFNYDSTVNLLDFNLLAQKFGTSVGPEVLGATRIGAAAGKSRIIDALHDDLLA